MFEKLAIRIAKSEDVNAIAQLSTQTFRDTFATEDNEPDIAAYLKTACSIEQIEQELADERNTFLLAIAPSLTAPIGYAKLRVGTSEPCIDATNPIELERLYVDKAAIGGGVGSKLMQDCLERVGKLNYDIIWLGVWENNPRAIRFYERWNFETVGSHVFQLGSDKQNDLIMQRKILLE